MSTTLRGSAAGGHTGVRRLTGVTAGLWLAMMMSAPMGAEVDAMRHWDSGSTQISVREAHGSYYVAALFDVPQTMTAVMAVLTDYEKVPKFMPDVRISIVRERTPGHVLLEQEAEARFMLFSKRVHLLLEVHETSDSLRFRDTLNKSFTSYQGGWTVTAHEKRTIIGYTLTAKPSFSVPEFVLTRLLKRDAGRMIEGLRTELARRAPVE